VLVLVGVVVVLLFFTIINMDPATDDQNAAKRVRFDTAATDGSPSKSPMSMATDHIDSHVASLQIQVATILSRLSKTHLLLHSKMLHKKSQLSKMEDPTFIPRSARVKFELKVSKLTEQSTELQPLRDACSALITETQTQLKAKIVAVTTLELTCLASEILKDLATAFFVATQATIIASESTTLAPHKMVSTLMRRYSESLLKQIGCNEFAFTTVYKNVHGLATMPAPYAETVQEVYNLVDHNMPRPRTPSDEDTFASTLKRTLESLFIASLDIYVKQSKQNAIELALKKLSTEHFASRSTENAAMEVDMEPPATRVALQGLIDATVSRKTAHLVNEIKALKAANPSKNPKRGPSKPTGALTKKKSQGGGQPAAGRANASSVGTPPKSNRKSSPKSNGKKRGNQNRKKTANRQSTGRSS
jgi:hypothetical protein